MKKRYVTLYKAKKTSSLILAPVLLFSMLAFNAHIGRPQQEFIDPTGTYTLTGTVKKSRVIGHYGEIRALLLSNERIAICLYLNNGHPHYESGALLDTLTYTHNEARYIPSADTNCTVIFKFLARSVEISQLYSNPHSGCGFPPGVLTSTAFPKTSSEKPIIQDLSSHGISQ